MKRVLIAALAVVALAGCIKGPNDPPGVGEKRDEQTGKVYSVTVLLTMDDGCVVSDLYIRNEGTTKMIRCPSGEVGASWRNGKSTYNSLSIPIAETDDQRKAREAAWEQQQRAAALSKLTDAERKLLGIPK